MPQPPDHSFTLFLFCSFHLRLAYKGLLKCGNDHIRHQKLDRFPSTKITKINPIIKSWIERAINPDEPVVFLDTDGNGFLETNAIGVRAGGPINDFEASIVENIVLSLSVCGLDNSTIGVITPFRSQVSYNILKRSLKTFSIYFTLSPFDNITSHMFPLQPQLRILDDNPALQEPKSNGLEICTIDRFQGRDKSAIIISLVRSNNEGKVGRLLQDFRRLNVAFSRAKKKMIIVGSFTTLHRGSDVLRPVLDFMRQRNWVYKIPT